MRPAPTHPIHGSQRPGLKTTEFWVTVLPLAGIIIAVLMGRITTEQALNLWPVIMGALGYSISRGMAKSGK